MADPRPPTLQLLVAALFSRHDDALAWARRRLEERYGPIARAGPVFVFDQTTYYEASMGRDLHKQLVAFRDLIAPDRLPEIKHHTNALEREMAETARAAVGPVPTGLAPASGRAAVGERPAGLAAAGVPAPAGPGPPVPVVWAEPSTV